MPADSITLQIIIKLKDLLSRNLKLMQKGLGKFRSGIRGLSSAVLSLKGAFVGLGLGLIAKGFLDVAVSFEEMEMKLDALTKGRGRKTLQEINQWAKDMPVNTQQAVNSFTMMQAMGLNPTIEKMQTLVDVSVLFGEHAMPRVSRALGQMAALGKLSAEELNQLSEVGINTRQILRDAFGGKTVEEIQKSNIAIQDIIQAIWDGLQGKYGGAAAKAQNTWRGLMTMMASEFVEMRRQVMEAGLFDFLKAGVKEVVNYFKSLSPVDLQRNFKTVSNAIIDALTILGKAVGLVGDAWRGWSMIWDLLKIAFADFNVWLQDILLEEAKSMDKTLTAIENKIKGIGKIIQWLRERTGGTWFGADALADVDAFSSKMDAIIQSLADGKAYYADIAVAARDSLRSNVEAGSHYTKISKLLSDIKAKAEAIRIARERAAEAAFKIHKADQAAAAPTAKGSAAAVAKAELVELKAITESEMQIVKSSLDQGLITALDYYNKRYAAAEAIYIKEMALLQATAEATKKVDKKIAIDAQIIALEEKHKQNLFDIQEEELANEDRINLQKIDKEKAFQDLKSRELSMTAGGGLAATFDMELLALDQKHAEELARLSTYEDNKALIEEAHRVQKLEKETLLAKQQQRLQQMVLSTASTAFGGVASAAKTLYEGLGKKHKTFFKIYKAASIAQALIDTYKGATAAFTSLATIPYVGVVLGIAAAAAAIAAGMARVASIRSQTMATGGEVLGKSPNAKADNIPIWATAGEYMMPVDAVRHYGREKMAAIKNKLIPRNLLAGFSAPDAVSAMRTHFQAGGSVGQRALQRETRSELEDEDKINITNITDPNVMGQYLTSKPGERQIINIISENKHLVRNALFAYEG